MTLTFTNAPIGAKIWVEISLGVRHVGRKYAPGRIAEFSRKRGGWNIVDVETFGGGKDVRVTLRGYLPSQIQMNENMRKYSDKKYFVGSFNCDAGVQVLAGNPPQSNQLTGGLTGAGTIGLVARACGAGFWGTVAWMAIGGIIGVNIANIIEDKAVTKF